MSDRDREELELEALQRRLDDAFETTRPRRGFEDELWLRMQRKRPFAERVRDAFGGLIGGLRDAPAIPIAAVAVVLIAIIGVSVLNYSGVATFGGTHKEESAGAGAASAPAPRSDLYTGGQVPTPELHPGLIPNRGSIPGPAGGSSFAATASNLYFGPANLEWTGSFAVEQVAAPVLIYAEPTGAQMQASVASFGPTPGVTVQTAGSVPQLPTPPLFVISEQAAGSGAGGDPVVAATSFLSAHNVLPPWPYTVSVLQSGGTTRVIFEREFPLPGGDTAPLIDWTGERYGTEVDISAGGRREAAGPLPLALQSVTLPLISNTDAAQAAISQPPASGAALSPTPTVKLDQVELVYALAVAKGEGFYQPAYLFSGSFTYNGQTYVKRVLVPLVVPSLRS